jgi:DNA-binding MarR family transcriptional regulator
MPKPFIPTEEYFSSRPINAKLLQVATLIQRGASLEYGARFGLNWLEWNIIVAVGRAGGLTMGAIAANISRQPSQVTRAVNALVTRRVVARAAGKADRRELRVVLTSQGETIRQEIEAFAAARAQRLTQGVSQDELALAEAVLTKIRRNAVTMLERGDEAWADED